MVKNHHSFSLLAGIIAALAVALALRLPEAGIRPMHNDEAVNAIKFRDLDRHFDYKYDPNEYHGPTLAYFTLAWTRLTCAPDFDEFSEARFRLLTIAFGAGLILLLPLVEDGLGRKAALCAALLTAVSPAMVFYSRYYIHEMLLVFFTFLTLASGWRYWQSRRIGWAVMTGAALGLAQATKETFVLEIAAAGAAFAFSAVWYRCTLRPEKPAAPNARFPAKHAAAALAAWIGVVIVLFSSFFTNKKGIFDAIRTYLPWLHRTEGASPHIHPWNFYLERLIWFHTGKGPVWSEGLIIALAVVGVVVAFTHASHPDAGEGNKGFLRFLAVYTIALTAIYSVIAYKTPWCALGFLHGMILLAGVGMAGLLNWSRWRSVKILVGILLLAGAGQLALRAWQASTVHCADRGNPYVYGQTVPDLLNLVDLVNGVTDAQRNGGQTVIKVMAPDGGYWPLPWYLRRFKNVGWWSEIPPDPYAPIMIVSAKFKRDFDENKTHVMVGYFQLRPELFLELYVQADLWNAYLKAKPKE
ncbi:MAG TPA: flippase activity-associated protein Agl23 [Verrucomicrobiae bacterium]|nr:flippase activity-associated protein Agl23 [Verrucomicrobiae bacterium]